VNCYRKTLFMFLLTSKQGTTPIDRPGRAGGNYPWFAATRPTTQRGFVGSALPPAGAAPPFNERQTSPSQHNRSDGAETGGGAQRAGCSFWWGPNDENSRPMMGTWYVSGHQTHRSPSPPSPPPLRRDAIFPCSLPPPAQTDHNWSSATRRVPAFLPK
jgi:hypothetical protein